MSIELTPLPYKASLLEPFISERTVQLHHGGHQA
ncbi:MAG: superoxide dismutase [Fe], partial [Actinomycetota bacterium]|nr:superoxide dismutase [Fe] [Actinomycetota bacterium]